MELNYLNKGYTVEYTKKYRKSENYGLHSWASGSENIKIKTGLKITWIHFV